ncbi:hypothetical protein [Microbacterium sp. EST19A]|uniref:hypothetical protein n=1 Tax=Microbacterium sp. EST19A TaxID=2862681 RepID=UPI001CC04A6A|nr:hypothetical protein [Microbacterium sp. EST19A]
MSRTHSAAPRRRSKRPLGIAAAAAIGVMGLVGGIAAPAMAWGTVSVGAPAGCTGHATGKSWKSGSTAYASTAESGNLCVAIVPVHAGLRLSGGSTLWNGTAGVSFAQASALAANGYVGGWHVWGAKVAS